MPLDQWQASAGLHSGEALNDITVSFLPIGVAVASGAQRENRERSGHEGGGGEGRAGDPSKLNNNKVLCK